MEELCGELGTKWGVNCKLFIQFAVYVNMSLLTRYCDICFQRTTSGKITFHSELPPIICNCKLNIIVNCHKVAGNGPRANLTLW